MYFRQTVLDSDEVFCQMSKLSCKKVIADRILIESTIKFINENEDVKKSIN